MAKILVVDDEKLVLETVKRSFEREGHCVLTSIKALGISKIIGEFEPDLVLMDQKMPGLSGSNMVKVLKELKPETAIFLFSNLDKDQLARLAEECGADGYVKKVEGMRYLLAEVKRFLGRKGA